MRLAREEKKGRFVAMVIIFVCLTAVFVFTLAKNQIIDGKTETASNTASVETDEDVKIYDPTTMHVNADLADRCNHG